MAMSVALVSCLTFLVIVYWIGAVFIYMRRRDEEKSTVGGSCCAGTKCGDCSVCRRMCEHVGMFLCGIGLVRTNVGVPFDVREKRGYFVGRLMTAVLLAGTAVLLSPSLMQLFSGGDASAAAAHKSHQSNFLGGGADLCGEGEMEALLAELNAEIDDLMHLSAARQQLNLTRQFGDALQADVSLWGDPGHQCNDLVSHRPVSREQFHGSHPNDGPYFPGWCKEASETALRAARTRTCEATGPEICVFAPLGFCVKTYTPTVTVKCPNHAAASNIETQQEDYRVEQLRFANARAEALDLQQQAMSLALEQGGAKDTAKSIVTRLLYQLDVASNVYIAYTVLGLFFPTPVVLHKTGIFTRIKRTLFGVHKTNFMLLFVAGWWCYDYYYMLLDTPAIQIYLSNLSLNPCYLDGEHMRQRQEMLATSCAELRTMLANFTVASITIEDTLNEVDHFAHNCHCDYPNVALADTPFSCTRCGAPGSERAPVQSNPCCVEGAQPPTLLQDNLFTSRHPGLDRVFWTPEPSVRANGSDAPTQNFTFRGDPRLCDDSEYARETLYQAPDTSLDFVQLWIRTGILAQFVAKAFAANLAVSLLAFVDPLSMYGGKYEAAKSGGSSDEREAADDMGTLEKQASDVRGAGPLTLGEEARVIELLQTAAFRSSIVWTMLLCGSVANIFYAIAEQDTDLPGQDVLWATVFAYGTAVAVGALICRCLFSNMEGGGGGSGKKRGSDSQLESKLSDAASNPVTSNS